MIEDVGLGLGHGEASPTGDVQADAMRRAMDARNQAKRRGPPSLRGRHPANLPRMRAYAYAAFAATALRQAVITSSPSSSSSSEMTSGVRNRITFP